jgi:hypothetical protein
MEYVAQLCKRILKRERHQANCCRDEENAKIVFKQSISRLQIVRITMLYLESVIWREREREKVNNLLENTYITVLAALPCAFVISDIHAQFTCIWFIKCLCSVTVPPCTLNCVI